MTCVCCQDFTSVAYASDKVEGTLCQECAGELNFGLMPPLHRAPHVPKNMTIVSRNRRPGSSAPRSASYNLDKVRCVRLDDADGRPRPYTGPRPRA